MEEVLATEDDRRDRLTRLSRDARQMDPEFAPLFTAAKARVAAIRVRLIEIAGPIERTLFEVYAALALATPHNSFETH
jgi:hypothetical protein